MVEELKETGTLGLNLDQAVERPRSRRIPMFKGPLMSNQPSNALPGELELDKVYNADCLDLMAKMPNDFIDAVVTSPPYDDMRSYEGNSGLDFVAVAKSLYRVVKPGGVVVWVIGDQVKNGDESGTSFTHALLFKETGFKLFDTMIYQKPCRGAMGNNQTYWQSFEYMFVLSKDTPKTINLLMDRPNKEARSGDHGNKRLHDGTLKPMDRGGYGKYGRRTNIWRYVNGNGHSASDKYAKGHPAIFPEALAADHIASWSNPGDIIFDPFCGSGTTAKMAVLANRRFIASDIVDKYCRIASKRIELVRNEQTKNL